MTRALRNTENYIDSCIKSMNDTIDYTKKADDGRDADYKRNWAMKLIEKDFDRGSGALILACAYLEEIEYDGMYKLHDKLLKAYEKAKDRVKEEIK